METCHVVEKTEIFLVTVITGVNKSVGCSGCIFRMGVLGRWRGSHLPWTGFIKTRDGHPLPVSPLVADELLEMFLHQLNKVVRGFEISIENAAWVQSGPKHLDLLELVYFQIMRIHHSSLEIEENTKGTRITSKSLETLFELLLRSGTSVSSGWFRSACPRYLDRCRNQCPIDY